MYDPSTVVDKNYFKKKGYYIWFNGDGEVKSEYVGLLEGVDGPLSGKCKLDLTKKSIFMMVTHDLHTMMVSFHYEDQH